jgi:hypothetical protein
VGAGVALYFFSRRVRVCGFGGHADGTPASSSRQAAGAFKDSYKAPNNWLEALYFFAEALRLAVIFVSGHRFSIAMKGLFIQVACTSTDQ